MYFMKTIERENNSYAITGRQWNDIVLKLTLLSCAYCEYSRDVAFRAVLTAAVKASITSIWVKVRLCEYFSMSTKTTCKLAVRLCFVVIAFRCSELSPITDSSRFCWDGSWSSSTVRKKTVGRQYLKAKELGRIDEQAVISYYFTQQGQAVNKLRPDGLSG